MDSAAETQVETHQEQLQRLNREVQSLRDQLKQAQRLATVGTMTAMVAHEFNNILTPIINYAQMARTNPALADKAIARAADGGRRATDICNAILGVVRQQDTTTAVNIAQLIDDTLMAMARDPRKDGIDLTLDVPPDLTVTGRRVELQQVLLNLLINARWAVQQKGRNKTIAIDARKKASSVVILVRDTGVGIPPENLQRIFQPFFSTKPADDSQGHGLGLTICRDILKSMGGDICVESQLGEGTTFSLRLPA